MYVDVISAKGTCYSCVPCAASDSAAALGASESAAALGASASAATGASESAASVEALHTLTLESGASRCFFRDCTTVTPLAAPVPPGSSLYTLTTASTQVAVSGQDDASSQVSASGQLAASCSCRVLSHQTLLWHHRLGHPSLPSLRSMHSRLLVSGLPRSLPPLPRSLAPPCHSCVEGRQRAAPHSSEFPPTTAPLQTLHMDVWGLAPVKERTRSATSCLYDYTRYTTVVPLRSKADVRGVLIPWICAARHQLRERFWRDLPGIVQSFTLPASPQKNGIAERRIGLIMEVARTSMIHAVAPHFLWPFAVRYAAHQLNLWPRFSLLETLPTLRWTGEVGDASSFRVWGALALVRNTTASKLSPRTLRCAFLGFPTDASPWQFYHPRSRRGPAPSSVSQIDPPPLVEPLVISSDTTGPAEGGDPAADDTATTRCSPRLETPPGFPPRSSSPTLQPVAVDTGAAGGFDTGGEDVGGGGHGGAETGGEGSGCADSGGAASPSGGGVVGAPSASPDLGVLQLLELLELEGTGGAGAGGAAAARAGDIGGTGATGSVGTRAASAAGTGGVGAAGAGGARAAGTGGAGAASPRSARTRGVGAAGAGGAAGARVAGGATGGAGAAGTSGAGGAGGAGATGGMGTAPRRPFFYPQSQSSLPPPDLVLRQVLSLPSSTGLTPPLLCPPTDLSQPQLLHGSPLPAPTHHTEVTESPTERLEPETRASTLVRARRVVRSRPPALLGTRGMALRPSSVPQRVVLPQPPASSLPHFPNPESDLALAASPTVTRLLDTVITDPDFDSTAAFALVTELVEFSARCRLDYVASLLTESESVCPPSLLGEPALGSDVLEDTQFELECLVAALPRFASMLLCPEGDRDAPDIPTPCTYAEAIAGEFSSQWHTAMDAKMASLKSTGTYVDEVPPPGANIVDGMWIFRVKRPLRSPPTFKARYVAQAQRNYELHSLDFSTAFLQGSLHEEIWLRRPPSFTGSFPAGTQTTLAALGFGPLSADPTLFLRSDTSRQPFYVLVYVDDLVFAISDTEALALVKAELHERHTCIDLGPSALRLTVLLATSHSSAYWPLALSSTFGRVRRAEWSPPGLLCGSCTSGMGLVLGGRGLVVLTGHSDASWADDQATQSSSQGYTFSLGSGSVSWRSTHSSSVLGSTCEADIYARAMAAQELCWLTYLLTDLGERPRSPPVLYVDNKAMLALCHEQRLEHRTMHIFLRYLLARELQQRGQLRLSYVAFRANTADVFTKALGMVIITVSAPLLGFFLLRLTCWWLDFALYCDLYI
ncbi:unnamed protein product [Closterium sp. NIES-53]